MGRQVKLNMIGYGVCHNTMSLFILCNLCSFGLAFLQSFIFDVLVCLILRDICQTKGVRPTAFYMDDLFLTFFCFDVTGLKWVLCHFMFIFKCAINYISNVF